MVAFSKFVRFFPLGKATAAVVRKRIEEEMLLVFGVLQYLICDNSNQFKSRSFKQMCRSYQVKINFNALYRPQTNVAERVNRVLKTMIS